MPYYAHKSEDGRLQTMKEHAFSVAELAEKFAGTFGFAEYGRAVGLGHDLGKYARAFQERLDGNRARYEHSSAGAYLLAQKGMMTKSPVYMMLAHVIAGHHSGLPDTGTTYSPEDEGTFFAKYNRRQKMQYDFGAYEAEIGQIDVSMPLPKEYKNYYSLQFLGRMLFSALVDADFLDTERFMSAGKVMRLPGDDIATLKARFDAYMQKMFTGATGPINEKRGEILAACRRAAEGEQGIYRLTVPTGGGKTLSSLAFALGHAKEHGLRRIIYVIPYINIISQTVEIFSEILGEENVLAHYSTAEYKIPEEERSPAELAAENWDKPVVVTTNVQFFESIHSCKPSRCRKLHNIAKSVLIFDEAQMLPVGYLRSCLRAIEELVKNYGCTAVLCSATQPALDGILPMGVREICPDVPEMYEFFRRVTYKVVGEMSDEELAEKILSAGSALCVVNSRRGARQIYDLIKGDSAFHLSTYMKPSHIARKLEEIRFALKAGKPCRVVSTSLVEAGVDLDFPAVFREEAGLDSIIQAGGRCNREGRRDASESIVTVFRRAESNPRFDAVRAITARVCNDFDDIASPEAIKKYFSELYYVSPSTQNDKLDAKGIMQMLEKSSFMYRTVSENYRLIEAEQRQVFVPDEENADICELLRRGIRNREIMRRASRDCVSLYPYEYAELAKTGVLTEFGDIAILEDTNCYDDAIGLIVKDTCEALFA